MEAAKKTREVYKGKFTRAENSLLESLEQSQQVKSIVEKRFKNLKVAWKEAQEKHEFYVSLLPVEELDETWIVELAERFERREDEIDKYLLDLEKEETEKERRCSEQKEEVIIRGLQANWLQEMEIFQVTVTQVEKCVSSEVSADLELAVKEDLRFLGKGMVLCERTQEEYVQELSK